MVRLDPALIGHRRGLSRSDPIGGGNWLAISSSPGMEPPLSRASLNTACRIHLQTGLYLLAALIAAPIPETAPLFLAWGVNGFLLIQTRRKLVSGNDTVRRQRKQHRRRNQNTFAAATLTKSPWPAAVKIGIDGGYTANRLRREVPGIQATEAKR